MSSLVLNTHMEPLVNRLWPEVEALRTLRSVVLVMGGSLLLAAASQLTLPMWPVPMTAQTFAVLLIGMAYGSRLGMLTVIAYLLEGAMGFPVFAGGVSGLAAFGGPSGGYLVGFLLGAGVTGWLASRGWGRSALSTAFAMLAGNVVLYIPGLLWLSAFLHFDLHATLAAGLFPFVLGDLAKLLLATAAMPLAWRLIGGPKR